MSDVAPLPRWIHFYRAGWRPTAGWVGVTILWWQCMGRDVFGFHDAADIAAITGAVTALLGFAASRSYDKMNGGA